MVKISFALIQLRPSQAEDRRQFYNENIEKAVRMIRGAAAQGAKVIILPEQFARDASCYGKLDAQDRPAPQVLEGLAKELNVTLMAGIDGVWKDENIRNIGFFVWNHGNGKRMVFSEKVHYMFDDEKALFKSRNRGFRKGTLANENMCICSGTDFAANDTAAQILSNDLRFVFVLSHRRVFFDSIEWRNLLIHRAKKGKCYVIAVAPAPNGTETPYAGNSMVVSPEGTVLCWVENDEATLYFGLELEPSKPPEKPAQAPKKETAAAPPPKKAPSPQPPPAKPAKPPKAQKPLTDPRFEPIYRVVRLIPRGRVTNFGTISRVLQSAGYNVDPQTVSYAMTVCRDRSIPCHRVVDRQGNTKTAGDHFSLGDQRAMLLAEGIRLTRFGEVYSEYFISEDFFYE